MSTYDKATRHTICTPEQQERVLHGIRLGMSLVGAARLVGRSREWLKLARKGNPEFGERCAVALGEVEQRMTEQIAEASSSGDGPLTNALVKMRSNRFPHQFSDDARMRYSIETSGEEHDDDVDGAKVQDGGIPPDIRDAILTSYYAGRDKPPEEP